MSVLFILPFFLVSDQGNGAGKELTDEDMAVLRAFEFKLRYKLPDNGFESLPNYFPDQKGLNTLKMSKRRLRYLAYFKPQPYDCCINVCVCYTGSYANMDYCPHCKESRFKDDSKRIPQKRFTYIPMTERLCSMLRNRDFSAIMKFRATHYPYDPSADPQEIPPKVQDIFDGSNYRHLQAQQVVVDGVEQPYHFFEQETDIALGFSTDGFCPFRRRKKSCWPLLVFNYNLPPEFRFHLKWALCIGVIPGPTKPKDSNSFLWPFVQECKKLALGVRTFSILDNGNIKLRAYPIVGFGDIPAVSMCLCMKGHNGVTPCRWCKIKGVRQGRTYYVPLARVPPEKPYDARNLPQRDHRSFLSDGVKAEDPKVSGATREARAKASGIKGTTILSEIPSFVFPNSFPFDFMHLIFENLIKNLFKLWTGEFKDMDHTDEDYVIDAEVWRAIGEATKKSGATIPGAFGARPKDFMNEMGSTTAETWSFWMQYLGPVQLRREFKNKEIYHHFVDLVVLVNLCLRFESSREDVETIREGFAKWVEKYEEYASSL